MGCHIVNGADLFYKPLTPQQSEKAFKNEYDLDAPEAIDFDLLIERLRDLKQGKRAEVPVYSFQKHQRQAQTTSIYSPHVLVLEGIYALYDPRILELLDMKIFVEADADLCLSRRIVRDVRARGRDIEGCIKQWFAFVKPNFQRHVDPQRNTADIIVPRGIENKVAIDMVAKHIQRLLTEKSRIHQATLRKLGIDAQGEPLSPNVLLLKQTRQIIAISTILQNPATEEVDFIFYFDRLAALLVETALDNIHFKETRIHTPQGYEYQGLSPVGEVSAVCILRAGSAFETGLKRVIPDCRTGRLLIKTNYRTGEPELHYRKLPLSIAEHDGVLLLDPQMSSGGAALMAVKVLVDHGVPEESIVFVTYSAGRIGLNRLLKVFPGIKVVACKITDGFEERWVAKRYFGC